MDEANKKTVYKKTIASVAIHPENESPLYSEQMTMITITDEAAGIFVDITQPTVGNGRGKISLTKEEIEPVMMAAMELIRNAEEGNG